MDHYDAIVIGCGGVGTAALYHLACRGRRALGIDRFPPGHDRGSSHGETRIIRRAYFEHPDYVPLLHTAYEMWDRLAAERGVSLRRDTGLLQIGPADGPVIRGVLASASEYGLRVQQLSARDVNRRFPGLAVPKRMVGAYEPGAGFLHVEACVRAHADAARERGAELNSGVTVSGWRVEGASVVVDSDRGSVTGDRLIITPGAWAGDLLADLGIGFEVRRKSVFWFHCDDPRYRVDAGCPCFLYELPHGVFYGFPNLGSGTVKIAEHSGGPPVADPLRVERAERAEDRSRVDDFVADWLPGVSGRLARREVCMYTMTADEHFVVDRHPDHANVAFAAGLSGHGFKFAGVLGAALVELVVDGSTALPVDFLGVRRGALRPVSAVSDV